MNKEGGFALIAVLWLITTLVAIVGLQLAATRVGQQASINRLILLRGRWAAEACLAIVQARWHAQRLTDTATVDLGNRTACGWHVDDPGARINLNTADGETLARLLGDSLLVAWILEARRATPFASVSQIGGQYEDLLTVDGPDAVNLNAASGRVLAALPGLGGEAVERIVSRRLVRPIGSLDDLADLLSPPAREMLLARIADLARVAGFGPSRLRVTATGWVDGRAPRANIEVTTVPMPERLAVVRRRMW